MKKFAFLALLFFIYYVAGMYESMALMVFFLTLFLLMAVMFLLSFYLKRHIRASFMDQIVYTEKGEPFEWRLRVDNTGRLPAGRFVLKFHQDRKGRKIQGNCGCGEHVLYFRNKEEHCGIFSVRADEFRVYDYIGIFFRKRHMKDEMTVIAFPKQAGMNIENCGLLSGSEELPSGNSLLPGEDHDEIRQIREYREGDPIRHIHWNQTARSGKLWIREYEESKGGIVLILDFPAGEQIPGDEADAFYTLVGAVITGLFAHVSVVHVRWKSGGMDICGSGQIRELFVRLYHMRGDCDVRRGYDERGACGEGETEKNGPGSLSESADLRDMPVIRLSADLTLYAGDRAVFQFSKERILEDLAGRAFSL